MLDEKDIKTISEVVHDTMGEVLAENVIPAIDQLSSEISGIKQKLTSMPDRDELFLT